VRGDKSISALDKYYAKQPEKNEALELIRRLPGHVTTADIMYT